MRSVIFAAVVLVSFVGRVYAELPKAVITGPTEGVPGDFVDLDGSESTAVHWVWVVEPARFADGKPTYRISGDGKQCQIATRPGTYRVQEIVANLEGIAFSYHQVYIGTPAPTYPALPPDDLPTPKPLPSPHPIPTPLPVPPVPTPTPIPTPVPPPPKPSPESLVDWVTKQVTVLVVDQDKVNVVHKLAEGYRKNLAHVATLVSDSVAFAKVQDNTNALIVDAMSTIPTWDAFFKALATKLASMNLDRPLQDKAWADIATGLEKVK